MSSPELKLSSKDARHLLARYHFAPRSTQQVFDHLGSVQYDPLKPVGRNHDLVLQARVPNYRVGAWEKAVYHARHAYDAWDKQACLTLISDWPYRKLYHRLFYERWRKRVFEAHPEAVRKALDELESHGPMSSLDFSEQSRVEGWVGSWYGPKLIKHVLRALWDSGQVVTHHRDKGRHVYDLPARVIPGAHYERDGIGTEESLRFLILRRHRSAGLLRPNAETGLWNLPIGSKERHRLIENLVAEGELLRVEIDGAVYHALPGFLSDTSQSEPEPMTFLAPLDSLLWDRKAVRLLYGFDYVWEVYKPEAKRLWGYYVLPVFYRDTFVARFDSRLEGETWHVYRWWWEPDAEVDADTLLALEAAVRAFKAYLGAHKLKVSRSLSKETRSAFREGFK